MQLGTVLGDLAGVVSTTFIGLGAQRTERAAAQAQLANQASQQQFQLLQFNAQRQDMQMLILVGAGLGAVYMFTRNRRR